jgi:hypothetical protein
VHLPLASVPTRLLAGRIGHDGDGAETTGHNACPLHNRGHDERRRISGEIHDWARHVDGPCGIQRIARHRGQIETDMTHIAEPRVGGDNADIGGVPPAADRIRLTARDIPRGGTRGTAGYPYSTVDVGSRGGGAPGERVSQSEDSRGPRTSDSWCLPRARLSSML